MNDLFAIGPILFFAKRVSTHINARKSAITIIAILVLRLDVNESFLLIAIGSIIALSNFFNESLMNAKA